MKLTNQNVAVPSGLTVNRMGLGFLLIDTEKHTSAIVRQRDLNQALETYRREGRLVER